MRAHGTGIAAFVLGLAACSGSASSVADAGPHAGGNSSGSAGGASGSSGAGALDDSGSLAGDDGGGSSSSGGSLDTSGWACPSETVLGDYSAGCVSCLETTCLTQLEACRTSSCMACEGPVFACETQSCQGPCTPGGGSGGEGGASPGEGGASSGTCAGLMKCCALIASASASLGAMCTSVASTGNQTSCQQILAMLPATLAPYCQ